VASPRSMEERWEWDVRTTVSRATEAAPPYLSAEVQGRTLHRGGCHCGAVRFEVPRPPALTRNPTPRPQP
jgi:hypothetical protein